MEPGIFERTFPRPTLAETLDAVVDHGLHWVQFDLASAGLSSLPVHIPAPVVEDIRRETSERGIRIAAVSGTYNMIHPDPAVREAGLAGLRAIAAACSRLGAPVITLCTGSRDPDNMWRHHPDNGTAAAWRDLLDAMTSALTIADEHDVLLGIEPEPANVVASAALGQRLLRELGHPRLKVVLDPANILAADRARPPLDVLTEAFDLLGDQIILAHAKDLDADGRFCAAGRGIVPWDDFVQLLRGVGFDGPLLLHSLTEDDATRAIGFLRQRIAAATA